MGWKRISENETLEYMKMYQYRVILEPAWEKRLDERHHSVNALLDVIHENLKLEGMKLISCKIVRPAILLIQAQYTRHSILAIAIFTTVLLAITLFGVNAAALSIHKLVSSPGGVIAISGILIVLILGAVIFLRRS